MRFRNNSHCYVLALAIVARTLDLAALTFKAVALSLVRLRNDLYVERGVKLTITYRYLCLGRATKLSLAP